MSNYGKGKCMQGKINSQKTNYVLL